VIQPEQVLFISPCRPDGVQASGTGLAARAAAVCGRLARRHQVRILTPDAAAAGWAERCRRWIRFTLPGLAPWCSSVPGDWSASSAADAAVAGAWHGRVSRVHVFRLAMAPWIARLTATCRRDLDLDESESQTRGRIAALARRNGHHGLAAALAAESAFYARAEQEWLPRFDRVYVSSRVEADAIRDRVPGIDVGVIPNVVPLPAEPLRVARGGPFTMVFVGNLGYYPNHDAVCRLVRDILPGWRSRDRADVRLLVAGRGAGRSLRRLMARDDRVEHLGYVPDLTAVYARADVAVVPLRAGGGTRIKILEALAWRVPVVATPEAAEGLDLVADQQILVADSAAALVHACERLRDDHALALRLADRGREHVAARHGDAALASLD
jgi:glycosyltransferase involved in cell wall biosynthesis